jgi:hypothetical protein
MSNGPEFFQTPMGRQFYDGTMPRIAKALDRVAAALEKQLTPDVVAAIVRELDGTEWSADTVDAIAGILRRAGYTVRDYKGGQ